MASFLHLSSQLHIKILSWWLRGKTESNLFPTWLCNKEIWQKQHHGIYDFDASQQIFLSAKSIPAQEAEFLLSGLNTFYKSKSTGQTKASVSIAWILLSAKILR